jgi:hypothetical protein
LVWILVTTSVLLFSQLHEGNAENIVGAILGMVPQRGTSDKQLPQRGTSDKQLDECFPWDAEDHGSDSSTLSGFLGRWIWATKHTAAPVPNKPRRKTEKLDSEDFGNAGFLDVVVLLGANKSPSPPQACKLTARRRETIVDSSNHDMCDDG